MNTEEEYELVGEGYFQEEEEDVVMKIRRRRSIKEYLAEATNKIYIGKQSALFSEEESPSML